MLNIKEYSSIQFYIFFVTIFAYLLFSSISNAILIDDERQNDDPNNAKMAYGVMMIIATIVWAILVGIILYNMIKERPL